MIPKEQSFHDRIMTAADIALARIALVVVSRIRKPR